MVVTDLLHDLDFSEALAVLGLCFVLCWNLMRWARPYPLGIGVVALPGMVVLIIFEMAFYQIMDIMTNLMLQ